MSVSDVTSEYNRCMQSDVQILPINVAELRARLRKMSDEKLIEYGEDDRPVEKPQRSPETGGITEIVACEVEAEDLCGIAHFCNMSYEIKREY
jgi:hypothetical protein